MQIHFKNPSAKKRPPHPIPPAVSAKMREEMPAPQEELPREEIAPVCEEVHPHAGTVAPLPSYEDTLGLADFFKLFGDPTRLRILLALDGGEMCVCDLAEATGMTKSAVSHQLSALRAGHLVSFRREGKNVYYTLADDHVRIIIEYAVEHLREPYENV